jgi:hypothetical protein
MGLKYIKSSVFWNVTPWILVRICVSSEFPAKLNAVKKWRRDRLGASGKSPNRVRTTLRWRQGGSKNVGEPVTSCDGVTFQKTILHSHSTPQPLLPPRHADKRALPVPHAGAAVKRSIHSVKLSDFTVWGQTWRKNWVNYAVLTGNSACLRTVLSSRLSYRELRSSLRESHKHSVQFFYTVTHWNTNFLRKKWFKDRFKIDL